MKRRANVMVQERLDNGCDTASGNGPGRGATPDRTGVTWDAGLHTILVHLRRHGAIPLGARYGSVCVKACPSISSGPTGGAAGSRAGRACYSLA